MSPDHALHRTHLPHADIRNPSASYWPSELRWRQRYALFPHLRGADRL